MLNGVTGPILITGHTGFKGTWLSLALAARGIQTVGISLPPKKDSLYEMVGMHQKNEEYFLDIRDKKKLDSVITKIRPRAVIHLAAQALVLESYEEPLETFETNVIGTANLLDSLVKIDSCKFIGVATTDKVYRNLESDRNFIESDPLEGKDPYSASKVGAEAVIKAWQNISKLKSGPKIVSFRSGNVIGGGDVSENRLLPDLIKSFNSSETAVIRNPESTRPWQHVLDPLRGYVMAMELSLKGTEIPSALNFGPNSPNLTVGQVAKLASDFWPKNAKYRTESTGSNLEAKFLSLSSNLALKQIGWTPLLTQTESIEITTSWWSKVFYHKINPQNACMEDISKYFIDSI